MSVILRGTNLTLLRSERQSLHHVNSTLTFSSAAVRMPTTPGLRTVLSNRLTFRPEMLALSPVLTTGTRQELYYSLTEGVNT